MLRQATVHVFDPTSATNRDRKIAKLDELVKKFADVTPAPKQESLLL